MMKSLQTSTNVATTDNNTVEIESDENIPVDAEPQRDEPVLPANGRPYQALFYDRTKPLTLVEAAGLFDDESKAIEEMPNKPSGGEVYLFRGKSSKCENDWRKAGHQLEQINGGRWAYGGLLLRKVAHLFTPEYPEGTSLFKRISWNHKNKANLTVIQYIGDHTLSVDFAHGNSKQGLPYTQGLFHH